MVRLSSSDDEEKLKQPLPRRKHHHAKHPHPARPHLSPTSALALGLVALTTWHYSDALGLSKRSNGSAGTLSVDGASLELYKETLDRCEDLHVLPGVPHDFKGRTASNRFVPGTAPTLIRNATVWTGEDNGREILYNTDVLLENGLIVKIGEDLRVALSHTKVVHAHGAWLTPGIVDMHSHVGVDSLPGLSGASDTNSHAGPILPYLRSLDGINGHDLAYRRVAAGGVTTTLVLPGSAGSVGGQAFVIKTRPVADRTIDSRVVELPWNVPNPNGEKRRKGDPPRWRHMKMAAGENPRRVYNQVRMDSIFQLRERLSEARTLKQKQDAFCARALQANGEGRVLASSSGEVEQFPDDLKLEAFVDVLRGKVLVNNHNYETTDLNGFIRLTHEFQFSIAAFHHAHEAYLVPDLLKNVWPGDGSATPAIALFSINGNYKREAWRGSPYAGAVLAENDIPVIYVSDHPVSDSRYVLSQAAQAHHFNLPANLALASVTTTPARVAGLSHRVGFVRQNHDADVVLWSSHPLALGATPSQVWIDGQPQIVEPQAVALPKEGEDARRNGPKSARLPADYDPTREQEDDGFEFLNPGETSREKGTEIVDKVKFVNVAELFLPASSSRGGGEGGLRAQDVKAPFEVVVEDGEIVCAAKSCATSARGEVRTVDLEGGSVLPSLTGYGTGLGLLEIIAEKSTVDGAVFDPFSQSSFSTTQETFASTHAIKALDGLAFGGKHLQVAEGAGVGKAVSCPQGTGFTLGVSAAFRTSAKNVLEKDAVIKGAAALHVRIGHRNSGSPKPSVATQIGYLRSLLLASSSDDDDFSHSSSSSSTNYFALVAAGRLPLVAHTDKADIIATLINLKKQVDAASGREGKWIIHGGAEAHLLASELADANIAVILTPVRAFPETWDDRRGLPGPPLTRQTAVTVLHSAGVKLAFGVQEEYQTRALLWEAAWASKLSEGGFTRKNAVEAVSTTLEELFGFASEEGGKREWVAWERDPFEFGSRQVAASTVDGRVKLWL